MRMLTIFVLAVISSFVGVSFGEEVPNVIIIYTDDQGFGDASCYNPKAKFQTPHLDRLAAEGIRFTNAHSSDTVCSPSRYGLLTGRYCWRTRLKKGVLGAEAPCLITDDRMTIASLLRERGYATGMVGKWHLGMDFPGETGSRDWSQPVRDMPLDKGFDHFFGIPASLNYGVLAWFEGRHAEEPPTKFTAKKPNKRHVDYRIKPPYQDTPEQTQAVLRKKGMEVAADFIDNQCLTRFTDEAINWMRPFAKTAESSPKEKSRPFFLYLPLTSPHYPVCPLPEFWGQGECGGYGEFVIETDYHVGRIMAFLEEARLTDNTLVVFTSDNGPENSWRGRIDDFGHRSNGPYRGGKRDIYEGGHRVPFIIRWPDGIDEPGRMSDALVGQIDVLATLAEIVKTDLPADAGEDSMSFANLLTDANVTHDRLRLVNHGAKGRFALTEGKWKLIAPHRNASWELYDLAEDPSETTNVVDDHPERVTHLKQQLTRIVTSGRTTPGLRQPNDTEYWDDLTWIDLEAY